VFRVHVVAERHEAQIVNVMFQCTTNSQR
jgi:hypothetical protein